MNDAARTGNLVSIGQVPWSRSDMLAKLGEFAQLYQERPIPDNAGGMRAPHLFMLWFALHVLKPRAVVESGVWLGQGTWLLERACPQAELYCIEPALQRIRYRSERARYFAQDFATIDWTALRREETLLFFDDHQNAYERLKQAKWFGFRHLIFEDNYPASRGDCYSLKQAFMRSGFVPEPGRSLRVRLRQAMRRLGLTSQWRPKGIPANDVDATYLNANLDTYHEFPPVFKTQRTRWNDPWSDEAYPTPEPLLTAIRDAREQIYVDEAVHYTWMCYVRLR